MPHILFVFLDGIGLGEPDRDRNPFSRYSLPAFEHLTGLQKWTHHLREVDTPTQVVRSIDATLSVEGLPQSGTGQATLFTGVNCAKIAGKHFGPYPYSTTKPVIAEKNIFRQINALPLNSATSVAFANAYPDRFFQAAQARNRWTVTTLSCIEADVPIRVYEDLIAGQAVTADLTGKGWVKHLGYAMDPISEADAAKNLLAVSQRHPFTLFEYYLTDKAGHSQSFETSQKVLLSLDIFFKTLIEHLPKNTTLIVTSDHGNLEDLSTKSHTYNRVPFVALGPMSHGFRTVSSLVDVTPAIVHAMHSQ